MSELREVYIRVGTEVVNRIPKKFIEFKDFWKQFKNDEDFTMIYLNSNNQIVY